MSTVDPLPRRGQDGQAQNPSAGSIALSTEESPTSDQRGESPSLQRALEERRRSHSGRHELQLCTDGVQNQSVEIQGTGRHALGGVLLPMSQNELSHRRKSLYDVVNSRRIPFTRISDAVQVTRWLAGSSRTLSAAPSSKLSRAGGRPLSPPAPPRLSQPCQRPNVEMYAARSLAACS